MLHNLDHMCLLCIAASWPSMKKLRTFQRSPLDDDGEIKQVLALLKLHTPACVVSEALAGGKLYSQRLDLQDQCEDLATHLAKLSPYMKKSVLTEDGGFCTQGLADEEH